ncbi:hypothetical protein MKA27_12975 [[Clostridium] innocuum]|nr:hypothetical protein [[Clostridium] innocuum]MCR0369758.1 hypothetical protein [[Clostridium] innocuum]MCR0374731.1 hypothetical protein [[Clostridium] innocuum]MCR0559711.1 hypothetical protein [[Clostridium] innocuum]MCR0602595.1 hypothetical protein [[Clostridium] innocuum]
METFSLEEILFLIAIGVIIFLLIGCLIRRCFRLFAVIFGVAIMFGFFFGYLPQKIDDYKNGDITKEELIKDSISKEAIDESLKTSKDYYDENKDNLNTIAESAFQKLKLLVNGE